MNEDRKGGFGTHSVNSSISKKSPVKNWIHTDEKIQDGVIYNVKYVGRIGINESMKSLNFETRTQVARESIRRIAECAELLSPSRQIRKNEEQLNRILSNRCNIDFSGLYVGLHINIQFLKVTHNETNEKFFQHTMQNISFACGGDSDIQDFVAYVAKDDQYGRACFVFECSGGLANNVITTIGHAFELRFKNFLNSNMQNLNSNSISSNATPLNRDEGHNSPKKTNNIKYKQDVTNTNLENANIDINETKLVSTLTPVLNLNSNNINNNHQISSKIEIPSKKFNPHVETTIPNGILSNNTNNRNNEKGSQHLGNNSQLNNKIDEKLEKMKWFHGLLVRENAEKLLVKDGDYLVRETNKADRQYVLSGRYKGECRHIFLVDPSGVVRTKDRVFDNICHLIQYHQENNIPIISKDNELLLENPVCKSFT